MTYHHVYAMFGYNKYVNIDDDDEYNINFGSVFSTKIHNLVLNNNSWVISRTSHLNTASHYNRFYKTLTIVSDKERVHEWNIHHVTINQFTEIS